MRESNFAFPAQNKACVCITSQLYDRRALDTTAALPLFNSLTHLTYLTSTSPRIREIMTMDGGLERLVRILHEFCICPPPPENPAILYGLTPPSARQPKLTPALNPHSFDKHAAYRFSLAFQCIVNIGVRGSEPIRSRVVQAGTLDVVGCILEAWLANKGFAVGPSSSATGMPRETREQKQQRRLAQLEHRQREEAAALQRALQRQLQVEQMQHRLVREAEREDARLGRTTTDDSMDYSPSPAESSISHILLLSQPSNSNSDTDVSTDNSVAATPQGTGTPTGSVVIPSRDRRGTIIARPVWDQLPPNTILPPTTAAAARRVRRHRELPPESPSPSTDVSRAETETEDDGDGDIDMDRSRDDNERLDSASPSPERRPRNIGVVVPQPHHVRRTVGIVSDEPTAGPQTLQVGGLDADVHIIINEAGGDGGVGVEVGVEDGIVSLEPNDDFAMGAPPGAPGALIGDGTTPRVLNLNTMNMDTGRRRNTVVEAPDVTPRAAVVGLPMMASVSTNGTIRGGQGGQGQHQRTATIRGRPAANANNANTDHTAATPMAGTGGAVATAAAAAASLNNTLGGGRPSSSVHHHRDSDSGPYRDEDVLLSLQLLAYLSKYPHVRQAFYKPRVTFHPASVNLPGARFGVGANASVGGVRERGKEREKEREREKEKETDTSSSSTSTTKEGFLRAFANATTGGSSSRGKDRAQPQQLSSSSASVSTQTQTTQTLVLTNTGGAPSSARQTNVFSLVERFTFKPSSTETDLPNPPPRLPSEIQYWAGVIMRNACRKDDSRGGIRQCANMMCGKWETYPREFAKCRRCRKAKYCGKECQSTAWSEGHRFWCSAKDVEEDNLGDHAQSNQSSATNTNTVNTPSTDNSATSIHIAVEGGGGDVRITVPVTTAQRPERTERERERERRRITRYDGDSDTGTVRTSHHHRHNLQPTALPPLPPPSGGGSSTTTYVNPTTSTTARAESSMSRDRTVQPHHVQPLRVRTRESAMPTTARGQHHYQAQQDPTNSSYLTFHVQSAGGRSQEQAGRRRAETITGAAAPSSFSNSVSIAASMSRSGTSRPVIPVEIPPNFIPPRPPPTTAAGGRTPVSPTTTNPDWHMAGSPTAGPSRRHYHVHHHRLVNVPTARPQHLSVEDDQDDMILG